MMPKNMRKVWQRLNRAHNRRYPRISSGLNRRNPDMARDLEMVSNDVYIKDKYCGSCYYCVFTLRIAQYQLKLVLLPDLVTGEVGSRVSPKNGVCISDAK